MGEPKGEKEERVRKTGGKKGEGEEGGCCCCDRGITSAPLTRKTFRLNLVLDSTRPPPLYPSTNTKKILYILRAIRNQRHSDSRIRFRFEVISINSGSVKWRKAWSSVESSVCFMLVAINANDQNSEPESSRACPFQFLRRVSLVLKEIEITR